jgi:hypothetical protein
VQEAHIFQWRSLKTRVTIFTLAIFLVSLWSLAFYAGRMLRQDMQRLLGEQQFSTVLLERLGLKVAPLSIGLQGAVDLADHGKAAVQLAAQHRKFRLDVGSGLQELSSAGDLGQGTARLAGEQREGAMSCFQEVLGAALSLVLLLQLIPLTHGGSQTIQFGKVPFQLRAVVPPFVL